MKLPLRALVALLAAVLATGAVNAQQAALSSERDKVGYMIGLDISRSIGPAMADIDMAAFQRAVEHAMGGGEPLLPADEARKTGQALMESIAARKGGKPAPSIDKTRVGLLLGSDVGRSLADIRGEFDLPMLLRGLRDGSDPAATRALDEAETNRVRSAFSARRTAAMQAARETAAAEASKQEQAFLARNKQVKGVFTTPSGLQYMVLRQGNGMRAKPGQRVKVNYHGTLLDGTVFDSSYERGEPASFRLDQVIAGWTEGVGMMPVGGKYRFWIPASLGYGDKGMGNDIPPNSTLVFDVELLGVE